MGSKLLKQQPSLVPLPAQRDIYYTPALLAQAIIKHFDPIGRILDPCKGKGAFFDHLPEGAEWCEILDGRDFYAWLTPVDWIIGNPPYSHLLEWIRHSFKVADNIVYLMPLHRVFASDSFLKDIEVYGGVAEILQCGTGSQWGFPFGHALAAVHYKRGHYIRTHWSRLEVAS